MVELISESSKKMYTKVMKKMLAKGESVNAVVGWAQLCLIQKNNFVSTKEISSWIKNDVQ